MPRFRELPEHGLSKLSDEQLIDYLRAARAAGRHDAMKAAVAVLVYGYWDILVARARLKLPGEADAEEVAAEVVAGAIVSAFDGSSVGEFRSWLHTILSRRIADWWEHQKRRPRTTALPSEHGDDEEVWGREPSVGPEHDALFARECIRRAYQEIEDERHREVIDRYVFGPHAAADAAAQVAHGMSEANVHQISSRFLRRVQELLDEGNTPG